MEPVPGHWALRLRTHGYKVSIHFKERVHNQITQALSPISWELTHYPLVLSSKRWYQNKPFSGFTVSLSPVFPLFYDKWQWFSGESWPSSPPQPRVWSRATFSAQMSEVWRISQGLLSPRMFPAIITFCDISSFCRKVFFYVKLFLIFSSDSMLFPKIYVLNPSQQFCSLSVAALNDKTHETPAFPPTLPPAGIRIILCF